jgi:hypothetical protein
MQRQVRIIRTLRSSQEPNIVDHRAAPATGWANLARCRPSQRTIGLMVGLVLSAACDGPASSTRSPTAPTTGSPTATYTVCGTVSESTSSGLTPVGGVLVRDGNSGRRATTDESGFYSVPGIPGSSSELTTLKADYVSTRTRVSISGDLRVDLLIRQIAAQTLSGVVFEMTESGRVGV